MTHRELTIEEAFYIREKNAKLKQKQAAMQAGDYFEGVNKQNQIKLDGGIDALNMTSMGRKNVGMMEKLS